MHVLTLAGPGRFAMLILKLAILLGGLGLLQEGLLELRRLIRPFVLPPSGPGQNKIIEHFAIQHVLLPVLGFLLVLDSAAMRAMLASPIARGFLGLVLILITVPELLVSMKGDLFRPYPFDLRPAALSTIQMVTIGNIKINLLQLMHVTLSHFALMGSIVWVCIDPDALGYFSS